jgi:lysophospholipase L1-like esterase
MTESNETHLKFHKFRFPIFIAAGLFVFLITEIFAEGMVIGYRYLKGQGNPELFERFIFSDLVISPFLPSSPVETYTSARNLGDQFDRDAQRQWYRADSILGWRLAPNVGRTKILLETDMLAWQITNNQGFASSGDLDFQYATDKPENNFRIVVLGGSTVEGDGSESPRHNLPAMLSNHLKQLQKKQKNPADRHIEVINAGVGGYGSAQELLYFITRVSDLKPDLVIVYDGFNERVTNRIFSMYGKDADPFRTSTHRMNEKIVDGAYTIGGAVAILRNATFSTLGRMSDRSGIVQAFNLMLQYLAGARLRSNENERNEIQYHPKVVKVYQRNLEDMIAVARQRQIPLAVFLQPVLGAGEKEFVGPEKTWAKTSASSIKFRQAFYTDARAMFGHLKKQFLTTREICVGDLSYVFRDNDKRLYEDSIHLLGAGNDIVGQRLVTELTACGMLDAIQ